MKLEEGRNEPRLVAVSPPTRGAWIEITRQPVSAGSISSPPTRGAWIEICFLIVRNMVLFVAPHTGGVD